MCKQGRVRGSGVKSDVTPRASAEPSVGWWEPAVSSVEAQKSPEESSREDAASCGAQVPSYTLRQSAGCGPFPEASISGKPRPCRFELLLSPAMLCVLCGSVAGIHPVSSGG